MSDQDAQKRAAAASALRFVENGKLLGVGSGSTVNFFIELLGASSARPSGCVPSSLATEKRLRDQGLPIAALDEYADLPLYVDGADEIDPARRMIKGGGAALTREKIVATAARKFVCIVDASKEKAHLGAFPLPIEVIDFARGFVADRLRAMGGSPTLRRGVTTDNGHVILDVKGLDFSDPDALERALNDLPGVVSSGIFAQRRADIVLVATPAGVVER